MELIAKGLKKITDILPFAKQNLILLNHKDLLKYIFINFPLYERVVITFTNLYR